jgi:hypothetical protein
MARKKKDSKKQKEDNDSREEGEDLLREMKEERKEDRKQPRPAARQKDAEEAKGSKRGAGEGERGTVVEYLKKQNRPYSLLNVFDNLHGAVKKGPL